ncbi:glutamine--fructose-6-phosphate transaminase (isomerizing) [Maritalea myrionectae]|uniref:Glutamine--fructose-6-phosphate transaminase (Isomerizing) n=1 Tax=Maritalea myrionectae TaxID=454601 RepID=A0A2R4MA57_9HYPH|nr:GNAT family protein [Maritalea myrionectae]AVX02918.1 glutamine--fructose-6-phosphate transaminase (isomerizing) [Maritalea myrionectae]
MSKWFAPITLEAQTAKLVPLSHDHLADLQAASAEGELHKLWYTSIAAPEKMEAEIDRRLGLQAEGMMLPFSVIDQRTGKIIGQTTFLNLNSTNRRAEIGATWYAKAAQRSPINTECKLMLLTHAFEDIKVNVVEFRTHHLNHQSRRAIERLGAKLDGILRNHMIMPNGSLRDTAVYSVLPHEWPAIKANLQWQLDKPRD